MEQPDFVATLGLLTAWGHPQPLKDLQGGDFCQRWTAASKTVSVSDAETVDPSLTMPDAEADDETEAHAL